ncbi:hypothetical protein AAFP30_17065 [Gordonia sp. CPCC 205515]|uniref:hypothetical protein n=1 Tax=Gordonia sp. CPCC 205515 TaxID=3140791 RepID=UPI003AF35D19
MAADRRLDDVRTARAELRAARDELAVAEIDAGVRRAPRAWVWLSVLAIVAVAAAATAVTLWVRAERAYTDADYQRAATSRVALLLSPDFRRADAARRILDGATGDFYDQFAQSADSYTEFVRSQGTVGRGTVDGAGVSARTGDSAAVLVAATVDFTTPPQTRQFRLRVLVAPDAGTLKLAAVQYLP